MAIRPELGQSLRLFHRRPWAISLALLIVMTSVSYAAEEPTEDTVAQLIERGPHAVLDVNPQGKIIPKPQNGKAANEFAQAIARGLDAAKVEGYFEVGPDFAVTLTPKGRAFAVETADERSFGCDEVQSVSADWLGFHLDLKSTCTQEELVERMGIDLEEVRRDEAEAHPVSASGFAPPRAPRPSGDSIISEVFGCFLTADTFVLGGSLLAIAWAVASPVTGWAVFWLRWGALSGSFFGAATNWVQNCTQVIRSEADVSRWVAYEPTRLPIATVGLGSLRITDGVRADDDGDAAWVRMKVRCSFRFYSNYRYSSYGYNVPTYIRHTC